MNTLRLRIERTGSGALAHLVGVAALLLSLVLMHGLGFGHETHTASAHPADGSVGQDHGVPAGVDRAGHPSMEHDAAADGGRVAAAGIPPDGAGHSVDFVQMCMAVLALVCLLGLVFLVPSTTPRRQESRPLMSGRGGLFDRPPWLRPDIHALCVMRT
jgi:hypothetical protein